MSDAHIELTVADHEKNGFVTLAKWPRMPEAEARAILDAIDATIDDASEPDIKTAPFTFILDLCSGYDLVDNGKRLLPTQVAMSLAQEQVSVWLDERPDPDSWANMGAPTLPLSALAERSKP